MHITEGNLYWLPLFLFVFNNFRGNFILDQTRIIASPGIPERKISHRLCRGRRVTHNASRLVHMSKEIMR